MGAQGFRRARRAGVAHRPSQVCPMERSARGRRRTSSSGSSPAPATASRSTTGIPIVNGKPVEGDWTIRPCLVGWRRLQFAQSDHDSARPLLHDGRQPWVERRQPLLGTRPRDWIIGKAFFTYWPPDRIGVLTTKQAAGAPRRSARRQRAFFGSTASSAAASSPAPTRRAAARWRAAGRRRGADRLRAPDACATAARSASSTTPSSAPPSSARRSTRRWSGRPPRSR